MFHRRAGNRAGCWSWVIPGSSPTVIPGNGRRGAAGDLVALTDEKGRFLATALLDPGDRVVARVLGRGQDAPRPGLGAGKVARRPRLCAARPCRPGGDPAFRLVNGEGDGLPGLTVDRYGEHLMVQLYTAAWKPHLPSVTAALRRFIPGGDL